MGKFRNLITLKDPEPGNEQNGFGGSVAIHNGYAVVGNDLGKSPDTGSVHIFKKSGMGFSYLQTLAAPEGEDGDYFGDSVAIHDGYIVVGARGDDVPYDEEGSVYVYHLDGGKFRNPQKLESPDKETDGQFGFSVAIHDGRVVVGQPYNQSIGGSSKQGSAYIFSYGY